MSEVTIRPAQVSDAMAIADLANGFIRNTTVSFEETPKTPQMIARDIETRGPAFLVAEIRGVFVGYATYFPFRAASGYWRTKEHTIQLSPGAQGKGAGRLLMTVLEDAARTEGVTTLMAAVSAENTAGAAFHQAVGFVEVGRLPGIGFKFGRALDLLLLQKNLVQAD